MVDGAGEVGCDKVGEEGRGERELMGEAEPCDEAVSTETSNSSSGSDGVNRAVEKGEGDRRLLRKRASPSSQWNAADGGGWKVKGLEESTRKWSGKGSWRRIVWSEGSTEGEGGEVGVVSHEL